MHVLVIEDDKALLDLMCAGLKHRGHTVEGRLTGIGTITILAGWAGQQPDLCVLDNHLREISGLSIAALAGKTERARHVPIILYSADSTLLEKAREIVHPSLHYMVKGRISDLFNRIDQLGKSETKTSGFSTV